MYIGFVIQYRQIRIFPKWISNSISDLPSMYRIYLYKIASFQHTSPEFCSILLRLYSRSTHFSECASPSRIPHMTSPIWRTEMTSPLLTCYVGQQHRESRALDARNLKYRKPVASQRERVKDKSDCELYTLWRRSLLRIYSLTQSNAD